MAGLLGTVHEYINVGGDTKDAAGNLIKDNVWDSQITTLVHEMLHILGFGNVLTGFYANKNW